MNDYLDSIRTAFPSLDMTSVEAVDHDGQHSDILLVNRDLIFRFPRYADELPALRNEVAVLDAVARRLPLPVPQPLYVALEAGPGRAFVGYRRLPGRPLTPADISGAAPKMRRAWATQMGEFLQALHATPVNGLEELGVADGAADWRELYEAFSRHLRPLMRPGAWPAVAAGFEAYLTGPVSAAFRPALRHGDFGAGNLLLDDTSGRLSGVIDFGAARPGDPAVDIAAAGTLGADVATRIEEVYPAAVEMRGRAAFIRSSFALQEALHGALHDDPEALEAGLRDYR